MESGLPGTACSCQHVTSYRHQFFLSEKPFQIQNTSGQITGNYLDGSPSMGKKKKEEMRKEGQVSDQNKIISAFSSTSEQSRSEHLDVREGTNCGNVGWNE